MTIIIVRFSAVRENGRISNVLYPPGESLAVLAFKKTLAKLFSVDTVSSSWSKDEQSIILTREWVEREGHGVGTKHVSKTTTIDAVSGAVTAVNTHEQISSDTHSGEPGEMVTLLSS